MENNININMKDLIDYLAIKDMDVEHWRSGYEELYKNR